jgi:chaperonin GroES
MKIEPLGARVLIRPLEETQTIAGGKLVLPDTAKEKPQQGIIEAIGDEEEMVTDLAVGDRVVFPKYTGTEIRLDGVDYLIMDESDVLVRLREEDGDEE